MNKAVRSIEFIILVMEDFQMSALIATFLVGLDPACLILTNKATQLSIRHGYSISSGTNEK